MYILCLFFQCQKGENDGGYAVSDYRTVDEKFGSMKDIKNISKIFRKKNMLNWI